MTMKKRISSLVFAMLAVLQVEAQQSSFMRMFRGTGTSQADIEEQVSGVLLVGMARGSGRSLFDAEGNILQTQSYKIDSLLLLQSVKRHSDNEHYFTGVYRANSCSIVSGSQNYPVLGRMDSLGQISDLRYFELVSETCLNQGGHLNVLPDRSVLIWGRDAQPFVIRTDADGNMTWARRFDQSGGIEFIKELPSGDLLAGMNTNVGGAVVARMDPMGNLIWCKSYIRPSGMVHDAVVLSDSSFIITGVTDSIASTNVLVPLAPDYQPKLFMLKLNGSGEVQWCKGYDSAPYDWYTWSGSRLVQAQDGNFVWLANLGVQGWNLPQRPFLMKLDQNGDTLWTRTHGQNGYTYETRDLLAYSDGGFIFNGQIEGLLPENQSSFAFLYKTDEEGHLPCHDQHQPITVVDLFPVDSAITLTSIDGAVAHPAFHTDTIYPPITVYDACILVPTQLREAYTIRKPRVYPNPTPGRFTVEFADPLLAESYYSVYDAVGKLLVQRKLPTGATVEEVDLSGHGKGAYVIKFTGPGGVCHERVVVE